MRRLLTGLLAAVLAVSLCACGSNYYTEDAVEENRVQFYLRHDGREAFASALLWDGSGESVDYVIPDTVKGAAVTAIGGLTGQMKKSPVSGLYVVMPETYRGAERAQYTTPANPEEVTLTVNIHIGRNVSSIRTDGGLPQETGYFGSGANAVSYLIRQVWVVTCDEYNETYYAEGGRLYQRGDGALVELPYGGN